MQSAPASSTIGDEVVGTPSIFGPAQLVMLLLSLNRIGLDNDNNSAIIIQSWLRGIIYLPTPSPIRGASHTTLLELSDWTMRSLAVAATVVKDLPRRGGHVWDVEGVSGR